MDFETVFANDRVQNSFAAKLSLCLEKIWSSSYSWIIEFVYLYTRFRILHTAHYVSSWLPFLIAKVYGFNLSSRFAYHAKWQKVQPFLISLAVWSDGYQSAIHTLQCSLSIRDPLIQV